MATALATGGVGAPASGAARFARLTVVAVLACVALVYLVSSLAAIANFSFDYPAFDQFRLYQSYLERPFPQNALQLENGHRPILPVLVRLAEIEWFDADQVLQRVVGVAAALAALALIVASVVRERTLEATTRASAVALAVLALFWLGNARMLMHSNELLHVHFIVLALVAALLVTIGSRGRPGVAAPVAVGLLCIAATFSFGPGVATFPAVLVLAALSRAPRRTYAAVGIALLVAALLYVVALPGGAGVRNTMSVDPLRNVVSLARWIASPSITAWLGMADPPFIDWVRRDALVGATRPIPLSADAISRLFGEEALMRESALVGAIGLTGYAVAMIHAWRRRGALDRVAALGIGIATFAASAGATVCIARLQAFAIEPLDVFADRYLPWSCLFWLGLALYGMASFRRGGAAALVVLLVAYVAWPTQRSLAGWSAVVHRNNAQAAVAADLGIWDAVRFPDGPDASRDDVRRTLADLETRKLAMFAEPDYALWHERWRAPAPTTRAVLDGASARVDRRFADVANERDAWSFEGEVPRIAGMGRDAIVAVVDASGTLRGLGKFAALGSRKTAFRFDVPPKRGFVGYVLDADAGETMHVLVLDPHDRAILARVPLAMVPPPAG